jgi:hypothetical protein
MRRSTPFAEPFATTTAPARDRTFSVEEEIDYLPVFDQLIPEKPVRFSPEASF